MTSPGWLRMLAASGAGGKAARHARKEPHHQPVYAAMNRDLPVPWMFVKLLLFVLLAGLAATCLLLQHPTWTTAACIGALTWAAARAYYFAFHVVEHWIDPGYRFHGLAHFFSWCWRRVRERCPHSARRPSP
ncbi:MAG: hypothetical protein ACK5UQ_07845 [Planctomycetota bacterium]